jgi:hypothetical protein
LRDIVAETRDPRKLDAHISGHLANEIVLRVASSIRSLAYPVWSRAPRRAYGNTRREFPPIYRRASVQVLARLSETLPPKIAPMSLVGRLVQPEQPAKVASHSVCMKLDALKGAIGDKVFTDKSHGVVNWYDQLRIA